MKRGLHLLGRIAIAAVALAGCRDDHHVPSPLAVSDYRLGAIERSASRLDAGDIDDEMLSVDAEAFGRPAGAPFRDAVTRFYQAIHPGCVASSREDGGQEADHIAEARAPLADFNALVARLELTPLRRDLELAWHRAALAGRKAVTPSDCRDAGGQAEIMRDARAQMRDALDRMEAAMAAPAN